MHRAGWHPRHGTLGRRGGVSNGCWRGGGGEVKGVGDIVHPRGGDLEVEGVGSILCPAPEIWASEIRLARLAISD
jgi:hypothetical protein